MQKFTVQEKCPFYPDEWYLGILTNMKKSKFMEQPSGKKNISKGLGGFLFFSKYLSTGRQAAF